MPRIYTSQVSATSGRSNSPLQNAPTSDVAFGGGVGRATAMLSDAIGNAADLDHKLKVEKLNKKRAEEAANKVALFDTTEKELALRNEVGPDGEGYNDRVREMYIEEVDTYVSDIQDDEVRTSVRTNLLAKLPSISSKAATYEAGIDEDYSKDQTNAALNALQNRIMIDPTGYDTHYQEGVNVISNKVGIDDNLKEGMKLTWRQNSAKRRFDGMLANATSKYEVDAIYNDLTNANGSGKDWAQDMLPVDFEGVMSTIASRKAQITKTAKSTANSVLSDLEGRAKNEPTQLFGNDELTAAQEFVRTSEDGALRSRMARIMRDQEIVRQDRGLPPSAIRRKINVTNGSPKRAYPNIPPVVSDAINEASEVFGVNASYLGGTSVREYGQFFKKPKSDLKAPPRFIGKDVRKEDLAPDVYNAVAQAGALLDQPLDIIDRATGGAVDGAVNISTLGMGSEEKIALTKALVNAGFTGFAEFDDSIQASVRDTIPERFGRKSEAEFFGGWTNLSPAVAVTLESMGFEAGKASNEIKRSAPVNMENDIDFGMPTQIKDAEGKPTSSAVGVMQFTDGTFLRVIKDRDVAAAIGVDTEGLSDKELLALRKDPRISVMAGAALAHKNKTQMENTLGRRVNDGELYLAHFLGAPRAVALLTARDEDPDMLVTQILPKAVIEANKPVFKDGNRIRSVEEVYDGAAAYFTTSPTQVSYDDNQVRKRLLEKTEKSLKEDPIAHAVSVDTHQVSDLTEEGGFAARSSEAMSIADYYNIPVRDMKPFTKDEADYLTKRFSDGNAEEKLQILGEVASMSPDISEAAFRQLAEYDHSLAYSGALYSEGYRDVATAVVRGQQRITDNPGVITQLDMDAIAFQESFVRATDNALLAVPPKHRQAVQEAATAYYVEQMARSGSFKWNNREYERAVNTVLGGGADTSVIDSVNGTTTVLPRGVNADMMEEAIGAMSIQDWTAMSATGTPPMYGDGAVIDPQDIQDEVQLRFLGGGRYNVVLDDGSVLVTNKVDRYGRATPYEFVPDADKLKRIMARPQSVARR